MSEARERRRLLIVRHAKAAREPPGGGPDHARPLTDRGEADARAAARRLVHAGVAADLIMSSPATRTAGTARIMAEALRYSPERIRWEPEVYNASLDTLLDVIAGCDAHVRRLMLVGHNPGLADLAALLVPGRRDGLPTSGIVVVDLPVDDWSAAGRSRGALAYADPA